NARIVSSAGARIEDEGRGGTFRGDLYQRLRVLPVLVPPLRERPDDVLPLANYFLKRAASAAHREAPTLARDAAAALRDYAWPGNVRELRHAVERALQSVNGPMIGIDHLPTEILDAAALEPDRQLARRPTLDDVERRYIAATLRLVRGNQTEAARVLG